MTAIDTFTGAFNDLARPNRFKVICARLGDVSALAKAATAPAQTVGQLDANYQGRIVKLAGDRTYADWTATFYGTDSYQIYRLATVWSTQINTPDGNTSAQPNAYKAPATVMQLDRTGSPIHTWNLIGVWPTEVGQVDFDWGTNDTPLEFTVTFAFDYMVPV